MSYKGLVLPKLGKDFDSGIAGMSLADIPRVPLKDSEIRIKMMANSLNFFDLLITTGQYQHKPKLPHVMGTEGSGVIIEVGSKVKGWKVGNEIMIGMGGTGTAAEEMILSAKAPILPKPKSWSFVEAAAFPVGFITAYHGLVHRGQLAAGETLLITGAAGGMGASCIQLGKKLGATVIACASSSEKLALCRELGADYTIDYSKENLKDRVNEITKGKMVDVVYEVVGGDIFDQCVRVMAPGGRLLVVGFTSGTIPKFAVNLALVKGFSLVGVRSGAELQRQPALGMEMIQKLSEWTTVREGKTSVVDARFLAPRVLSEHVYPLSQYSTAFNVVAKRMVKGKAVITVDDRASIVPSGSSSSSSSSSPRSKL